MSRHQCEENCQFTTIVTELTTVVNEHRATNNEQIVSYNYRNST